MAAEQATQNEKADVPLTPLEAEMRSVARTRIANERLPREAPIRAWASPGTGQLCDVCDKPILPDDTKYEDEHPVGTGFRRFRFHMLCQAAWQLECVRLSYSTTRSTTPAQE
jgi:hypothetical protein